MATSSCANNVSVRFSDPYFHKILVICFTYITFFSAIKVEGEESIFTLPEYEIIIEDEKLEVKQKIPGVSDEMREFEEILKSKNPTFQNDKDVDESLEQSVSDVREDKAFLKFKERIDSYPDQVLRYGKGEKPLLVSDSNKPPSPPDCELCGAKRKFEFQVPWINGKNIISIVV